MAILAKERIAPNFGNAGSVESLIGRAKQRLACAPARLQPLRPPGDAARCGRSAVRVRVWHPSCDRARGSGATEITLEDLGIDPIKQEAALLGEVEAEVRLTNRAHLSCAPPWR